LPDADDLDEPPGSSAGTPAVIDKAIAEFEDPGSDGGAVDN
jgi:hypothetical protein